MFAITDQAVARKASALYPFDGSDPNLIIALHAAFRAGAEFAVVEMLGTDNDDDVNALVTAVERGEHYGD